jgi:hypothetical protein
VGPDSKWNTSHIELHYESDPPALESSQSSHILSATDKWKAMFFLKEKNNTKYCEG